MLRRHTLGIHPRGKAEFVVQGQRRCTLGHLVAVKVLRTFHAAQRAFGAARAAAWQIWRSQISGVGEVRLAVVARRLIHRQMNELVRYKRCRCGQRLLGSEPNLHGLRRSGWRCGTCGKRSHVKRLQTAALRRSQTRHLVGDERVAKQHEFIQRAVEERLAGKRGLPHPHLVGWQRGSSNIANGDFCAIHKQTLCAHFFYAARASVIGGVMPRAIGQAGAAGNRLAAQRGGQLATIEINLTFALSAIAGGEQTTIGASGLKPKGETKAALRRNAVRVGQHIVTAIKLCAVAKAPGLPKAGAGWCEAMGRAIAIKVLRAGRAVGFLKVEPSRRAALPTHVVNRAAQRSAGADGAIAG